MDVFSDATRPEGDSKGGKLFDASQYAFFGNDVVEEVELGGLEDEDDIPEVGIEEKFSPDQEEPDDMISFPEVADLASAFSKLNKSVEGPKDAGLFGDRGSREITEISGSSAEWIQEVDYSTWYEQQNYYPENGSEGKRWSSLPYASAAHASMSIPLHRTSSHPVPQPQLLPHQQQNLLGESVLGPRSSFPSRPPPGRPQMILPNPQHPNNSYLSGGAQRGLHSQGSISGPLTGLAHGHFATNLPQFSPLSQSAEGHPPSQWLNRPDIGNNILPPQQSQQNGMTPQLIAQQQQHHSQQYRLHHPGPPPYGHLTGVHSHLYGPQLSASPPMLNKFDAMMNIPDIRDQRQKSSQKNRQNFPYPQMGFDTSSARDDGGWPVFRSKYMSTEEIENILRLQLVATHSNNPYVDDYYHQACLFKKSSGARLKHHFCPTQLRDLPPRARPTDEPHAFLQVEALGRIPFSSIRRPKPLLEVDPLNSGSAGSEQKIIDKPLEQEPMLAARVTIEDCLCLLLDVDDVDRFLQFNQFPEGEAELRQRRQSQLEGLVASLQLVDPLVKGGQGPIDDIVFLRIISLPKGRKLLGKYLGMLSPGSDLHRIVCMAIFRHLRFLFGVLPSDLAAVQATDHLVNGILTCINGMDLNGLSACLAAFVCSSEKPLLRPIGSSAGDGASIVLKSVLDKATVLFRDPRAVGSYDVSSQTFWKASFDEFFNLLLKYCFNKYESIVQPLQLQDSVGSDAASAIKTEMPVELLQASLPHISDHQHKLLMDLAQKSVPVAGSAGLGGNGSLD